MHSKGRLSTLGRLVSIGFLILVGFCETAAAQSCVTFTSVPENAALALNGPILIRGHSPSTFCSLTRGHNYQLRVEAFGFERRQLKFSLSSKDSTVRLSGDRVSYLGRSLIVPGAGQYAYGHTVEGLITFALSVGMAADAVFAYLDYDDEKDKFTLLSERADRAMDEGDRKRLENAALASAREANTLRTHVLETSALAGWLYLSNLFETFLLTAPPKIVSREAGNITIETPRKSRERAVFRSVLFPGMGQRYLGNDFKGSLFQAAFVLSGLMTIEERKDFDQATTDYEAASATLASAGTLNELEAARLEVDRTWEQRRDAERTRDTAYIVTGAVWALNLLDVLLLGDGGVGGMKLDTSYRDGTVETGLRVRF